MAGCYISSAAARTGVKRRRGAN